MSAGDGYRSELRSKAVLALANAASFPFSEGLRELVQASGVRLYEFLFYFILVWRSGGCFCSARDCHGGTVKKQRYILFTWVVIFV